MQPEIDWSKPQRQSKVVILLALVKMFKNMWPVVLLLFARFMLNKGSSGGENMWWVLGILGATIFIYFITRLNDIAGFFTYRFCIVNQQLIIYSGLIIKKKTELPLSKIQAIHTRQTFLHRITNTCKLIIDTAGSEKAEMDVEALDVTIAEQFQLALTVKDTTKTQQYTGVSDLPQRLLQLGPFDILKLCISENHLKTFLVVIVFLIGKMQDIREWLGFDSFGWMQQHSSAINASMQAIVIVFLLAMLFSIFVSCIKVMLRFYGFVIQLRQDDFIIKWGLLETHQKRVPFEKVQLLSWRSTFVRRLTGMSILRLHASAEDEGKEDQMIQVPVTRMPYLQTIVKYYQAIIPAEHYPRINIDRRYVARQVLLIGLPVTIILAAGFYFIIGWYALLAGIWLFYFTISRYLYRRNFKVWISDKAIQVEKGVWGRENLLVNFSKIQQVTIKNSPYKRKHKLADVRIHTTGTNLDIPFLEKEEAAFLVDFILAHIEFKEEINKLTMPLWYKL